MARNMNRETLEQKIAKTEKAISRKREQYDRLTAELEDLHKKKKAILNEEILKAVFLLRNFPHCWMNDIRNGKSRGQNRRCMMHTWKASVHWMKSLT